MFQRDGHGSERGGGVAGGKAVGSTTGKGMSVCLESKGLA